MKIGAILAMFLCGVCVAMAAEQPSAPAAAPTTKDSEPAKAPAAPAPRQRAPRLPAAEPLKVLPPLTIYTASNAPAAPTLEDLPLKESVAQYGITWTFSEPARVGQFLNGDWYVVGDVTVVKIDPAPKFGKDVSDDDLNENEKKYTAQGRLKVEQRLHNGSMHNPPAKVEVAWDSGVKNWYRPELAARLPVAMRPGDALVSTISLKKDQDANFVYHSSGRADPKNDNCPTLVGAVLTCVKEPLPADAFRPAYCDRGQTIYLSRNLKRDLLPKLAPVKNMPKPADFALVFQRPWLDLGFFGFDQPMENMPHYGQWVGQASSNAGLILCGDFPAEEKERLLVNVVQVGIDLFGAVKSGHPGWPCWGGHGSGRKFPIVLAGVMLGDEQMANVNRSFPKASFGEDEQTAYGDCWTGAKVVFAGHSGINAATGVGRNYERGAVWGPYEHLSPDKWTKDQHQSDAYRRANSSCCWVGQALALRLMKLEKAWNHDAFFDYMDRWMNEDDKPFRTEVGKAFPTDTALLDDSKGWYHQGNPGETWIGEMWTKYRDAEGLPPQDGWKKPHDDSYYKASIEKAEASKGQKNE